MSRAPIVGLAGPVGPRHPEAADIPAVDLAQGRVAPPARVVAVGRPVPVGLPIAAQGGETAQAQQREHADRASGDEAPHREDSALSTCSFDMSRVFMDGTSFPSSMAAGDAAVQCISRIPSISFCDSTRVDRGLDLNKRPFLFETAGRSTPRANEVRLLRTATDEALS